MTQDEDENKIKQIISELLTTIEQKISKLETGETLSQIFAAKNHNHNDQYATLNHEHDQRYSKINHTHGDYLSKIGTAFDSTRLGGRSSEEYSLANHTHPYIPYITPFQVTQTNGNMVIHGELDNIYDAIILEDPTGQIFQTQTNNTNTITLSYNNAITEHTYHVLYYSLTTNADKDTFITVLPATGSPDGEVELTSIIVDENNNPVPFGTVEYSLDYDD